MCLLSWIFISRRIFNGGADVKFDIKVARVLDSKKIAAWRVETYKSWEFLCACNGNVISIIYLGCALLASLYLHCFKWFMTW
jgi:hypothetical protein